MPFARLDSRDATWAVNGYRGISVKARFGNDLCRVGVVCRDDDQRIRIGLGVL